MIIGSGFSPAFGNVIFLIDAVVILLVLLVIFPERIIAACSAALHRATALLTCLVQHIGLRHR